MLPLHALFQRRIDGDDALLRLARLRFEQAGLAAELYAATASELEWNLGFAPRDARLADCPTWWLRAGRRPTSSGCRPATASSPGSPYRSVFGAERTDFWLRELCDNAVLVRACEAETGVIRS